MAKNCNPKAKKNVPSAAPKTTFQSFLANWPVAALAIGAGLVASAAILEKPSTEAALDWPVVVEEKAPVVVAEGQKPVEVTEGPKVEETAPEVKTEPGIDWPVVQDQAKPESEAKPVVPVQGPEEAKPAEVAAAPSRVDQEVGDTVKYDPVSNTISATPKKVEKKKASVKKKAGKKKPADKKPTEKKKTKKPVKMTSAHEDFMANFTRGQA